MSGASVQDAGQPKVKKDPLTPEILVESKITGESDLLFQILLSCVLLVTRVFLRFSELCHLKTCDVELSPRLCPFF